jgi:hypothetical protein
MAAQARGADDRREMTVLRLAAAGIVAVAAFALGTASVVAFVAGGYFWVACAYAAASAALLVAARRVRPRRRRAAGYLPLRFTM